jgi:hypothetical protein
VATGESGSYSGALAGDSTPGGLSGAVGELPTTAERPTTAGTERSAITAGLASEAAEDTATSAPAAGITQADVSALGTREADRGMGTEGDADLLSGEPVATITLADECELRDRAGARGYERGMPEGGDLVSDEPVATITPADECELRDRVGARGHERGMPEGGNLMSEPIASITPADECELRDRVGERGYEGGARDLAPEASMTNQQGSMVEVRFWPRCRRSSQTFCPGQCLVQCQCGGVAHACACSQRC